MKKDKALKIAESVLEQVGGKQNIAKVLHCQTRLRFNLKDESIANHEKIEAVQGVLGVVRAGGHRKWNFRCYFRKHGTCDSSHRRLRIL